MLPDKYRFLETIGVLPKLVSAALQYYGLKEIAGSANNPVIMDMAKGLGLGKVYTSDSDQAWCALFINHLIRITGKPMLNVKKDPYNYLRAKYLLNWGNPVTDLKLGDIVITERDGGGHVFILIGITPTGNFIGIGGNQNNSVNISEFDKKRVVGVRRYYATQAPESAILYTIASDGKLSTNEA